MSKSLKNFITIDVGIWLLTSLYLFTRPIAQEILQKFTARQLRLSFLSQLWNAKIDFSESMMTGEIKSLEVTFNVSPPCFVL